MPLLPVLPVADSLRRGVDGILTVSVDRDGLWRAQTPQGFRYGALVKSYEEIGPEKMGEFTDDCGIYMACHPMGQVRIVKGSSENIKITDSVDLVLADELFRIRQQQLAPNLNGLDLKGKHSVVFGGSAGIGKARAVKVVVGEDRNLLQVTETPQTPRRYFRLDDGAELKGQDARQAEFIARHYLKERRAVAEIVHQTQFDADYPWVNRLLPVWRVRFAGDDRLTAYVHTETSSLAAVNNTTKTRLQSVFRALHTWEWVPPGMDWLRVILGWHERFGVDIPEVDAQLLLDVARDAAHAVDRPAAPRTRRAPGHAGPEPRAPAVAL